MSSVKSLCALTGSFSVILLPFPFRLIIKDGQIVLLSIFLSTPPVSVVFVQTHLPMMPLVVVQESTTIHEIKGYTVLKIHFKKWILEGTLSVSLPYATLPADVRSDLSLSLRDQQDRGDLCVFRIASTLMEALSTGTTEMRKTRGRPPSLYCTIWCQVWSESQASAASSAGRTTCCRPFRAGWSEGGGGCVLVLAIFQYKRKSLFSGGFLKLTVDVQWEWLPSP